MPGVKNPNNRFSILDNRTNADKPHHDAKSCCENFACQMGSKALAIKFSKVQKLILKQTTHLSGMTFGSLSAIATFFPTATFAQSAIPNILSSEFLTSSSIIILALFAGAISFAMLATFWLIKERNRVSRDNLELKKRYNLHKTEKERMAALVNISDQRILTWDKDTNKPETIGVLDGEKDAPENSAEFAKFGKWLSPSSAIELEQAISDLQKNGSSFDILIETINGSFIETQGRISGSFPFVRFRELDSKSKDVASLSIEHERLLDKFNLMETLFQNVPFPVWLKNQDGKLHWVNNSYGNAVEAESNEIATKENRALFDKNERNQISQSQDDNGFFEGYLPAIVSGDRKNLHTFETTTQAGSYGLAIDRSEIEEARTQLKETIASHAQTIDNLTTAIAVFDANKNLAFANSSFQSQWDLGQSFLDEHPSNEQVLEAMKSSGKLSEMPDWKKWKAAQLEIYQATETRDEQWHLPDGQTLRVIASPQSQGGASWAFENVTEQLALKSNYNALMRVQGETLDHLNEAVAVFGSDGKIKLTNPIFLKMWNFEEAYALDGKHINSFSEKCANSLLNKEEWEEIRLGITGVSETRDNLSGQIELLNGSIFDYHLVRLPDAQTMLTLVDMTAVVNVERALKDRNDALEESDGLKTRFIQHVSYELRAPLTSIAGFAEILSSDMTGKLNSKQAEYLDYISQSSDVLKALIDDILDLATIDAGVMQLDLKPVLLDKVISEAIETLENKASRNQLKIKVAKFDKHLSLVADANRLRQIIYNLVSNALDASPDGGVVNIATEIKGGLLELSVRDQGSGIPDELKAKIFERFESGESTGRRKGAGLGLSIVKSFVELHQGEIVIEDAEKRGTKFICRLPLEPEASQVAAE